MSRSAVLSSVRRLRSLMAAQQNQEQDDEQLLSAFAERREDIAFAALVRRHGPMVLSVCRRVLSHEQDAEDAFQATFLVLAQRAASLRNKSAVASFLHGTAYHLALKAKRAAGRRRRYEGALGALTQPRSPADPTEELLWREVRLLLDEEVARLPEKYRSVFVLCCLEELSQAEAGRRLGLKEGAVANRLAEARKRLAQRLARRGVELTAALAVSTLAAQPATALPAGLMANTIEAALASAAGEGLSRMVSATVAELVRSATTALMVSKAKIATVVLLVVTLLGSAGVCFVASPQRQQGQPLLALRAGKQTEDAARSTKRETAKTVEIQGRVIDPAGKPVAGAKLLFIYGSGKEYPHKVWAVSAAEGRFAFTVPVKDVDNGYSERPWDGTYVVASAEGHGFAAARLGKPGASDLMLRLVKDDVPIRGRILNLEGKPIPGVRVRIADGLHRSKKGGLTDWLAALRASKQNPGNIDANYLTWLYSPAFDLLFPPVTTGADGRFEIKGVGRDRVALLRIEGPTIATQEVRVMTRASEMLRLPVQKEFPKGQSVTYVGASFDLLAAPSRPIVGVVRDKDSGQPLAGVTVESNRIAHAFHHGLIRTTTDKDGRYRLEGLAKGDGNEIVATTRYWLTALPKGDANQNAATVNELPYLAAIKKVGNPLGLGPVTVDFALKRGVWVKGCITEENTGKTMWAGVKYFCFSDNPNANEIARLGTIHNWRSSREDGSFQIPVLPGHGLIAVRAYHDHYVMGVGVERIKGPRAQGLSGCFRTTPALCFADNFHAVVEIDPKAGTESITCNVPLDPGRTRKGTVLGPDDKPLAGARVSGLKSMGFWANDPLPGADFMVECLQSNKTRLLQFRHDGRKLSGALLVRGEGKGPLRVRLQRWGTFTGRIVTPLGSPLTSVRVNCSTAVQRNGSTFWEEFQTVYPDKDGRFRIEGLAAGMKYELWVGRANVQVDLAGGNPKNLTIEPGETKDVGDLTVKPMK